MDATPFIRAILDHPEDDAPRLVYADWLDERGDPRGEFIRVQCELSAMGRPPTQEDDVLPRSMGGGYWEIPSFPGEYLVGDRIQFADDILLKKPMTRELFFVTKNGTLPDGSYFCLVKRTGQTWPVKKYERLRRRQHKLLESHEVEWLPDWWPAFSTSTGGSLQPTWERGFVESVACTQADFLVHAEVLFAACPIRDVRLTDKRPTFHPMSPPTWIWYSEAGFGLGPETITTTLFDRLERFEIAGYRGDYNINQGSSFHIHYSTEADATADLGRACVAYGNATRAADSAARAKA